MARLYAARSGSIRATPHPSSEGAWTAPSDTSPRIRLRRQSRRLGRQGGDSRHTACARHPHGRRRRHRSHRSLYLMVRLPHRGWLLDLDGTIYVGEALVPGAVETIAALRGDGRRVVFLSNKPLQTRADYAAKLTRLGVPAAAEDVINSSLVLARHLATLDVGAPVFVIGEPPLVAELTRSEEHTSELQSHHDLVCRL